MPRYYFDFCDGQTRHDDEEGLEFGSVAAASKEATATLGEMAREALASRRGPYDASVEVRDEAGAPLLHASLIFRVHPGASDRRAPRESHAAGLARRLDAAEKLVARQRDLVGTLAAGRHPTGQALELLDQFEGTLRIYRAHRDRLAR